MKQCFLKIYCEKDLTFWVVYLPLNHLQPAIKLLLMILLRICVVQRNSADSAVVNLSL